MHSMSKQWWIITLATALGACTTVPEPIKSAPPGDVQVAEARLDPERFRGTTVRWGGAIQSVRNERDSTVLEIVARRLDSSGQPREEDKSAGRFLAKAAGFLDPALYATGREVTVRGVIDGVSDAMIGDFPYRYPIVRVEYLHLWAPRPPPLPPYYWDPYWGYPGYPWGWPYRYPYYPPYW
ncbi:MAG: Slp family lipoprotein [Pseudomonadota bacterium]|nr:MAG: Slp family lipoprotein [Pseudomonadota bacterium]